MSADSNGPDFNGQSAALAALARCREKIDLIDRRLVDLLNERTVIVEEIGRVKKDAQLAIYEPKRETQVFENITSHNAGPLGSDSVKRIFERIIDEMRRVQKDRMVAGTTESTPESRKA
jgi:chorismate mutase/prephenate dehydratase